MLAKIGKKIFGSRNDRLLKQFYKVVKEINALEPELEGYSDEALMALTDAYKERYHEGETLEELLPEAFATTREVSRRVLGMRHFDVQLIGGMVLNSGRIAEMRTGEGKTLVATLPAYLNAIAGQGVHVVTVNDYLARRDAEWMSTLYEALGLTVGVVVPDMTQEAKKAAYAADITYGTNNEFGFDYLRDNMSFRKENKMQRDLTYAIVDEVDSILIDEARTPLIISGPTSNNSELYIQIDGLIKDMSPQPADDPEAPGDFVLDEKSRSAQLTEEGQDKVETLLSQHGLLPENESLYDPANIILMHHVDSAIRARFLYEKNVNYVVENGQVVIVDEFTGRKMQGRRWSEGLHQAVEAKEGVEIQNENQTLASITFQNYFRMYQKLSGMTGTADTEAYEFQQIYGLEVVVIPTNLPIAREDHVDQVYLTEAEKFNAIINDIEKCRERKQPVLVGTASIEASEYLSSLLNQRKIKHEVLNAKQHEREADIVAQAGKPGSVTIATNMAGRGTDIVLGGNFEVEVDTEQARQQAELSESQINELKQHWQKRHDDVLDAGGLHIIGTERHESRRIDNQLRGRAGRQGDKGSTQFYLSMQDKLMRIFASDRVTGMMQKLGMEEGESIQHPWVSKAIENAQRKVEAHNFDIRKHLLEFDDVANEQRKVIYEQRDELMETDDISELINSVRDEVVNQFIDQYIPPLSMSEQWDVEGLQQGLLAEYGLEVPVTEWLEDTSVNEDVLRRKVIEVVQQEHEQKEALIGEPDMRRMEKMVMLNVLDSLWKEHLAAMDYLRSSIGLRGYAQKDPKQEYKRESFEMFQTLLDKIKSEMIRSLTIMKFRAPEEQLNALADKLKQPEDIELSHPDASKAKLDQTSTGANFENPLSEDKARQALSDQPASPAQPFVREGKKVGRNDPCPCGSGKKYKQCHGRLS